MNIIATGLFALTTLAAGAPPVDLPEDCEGCEFDFVIYQGIWMGQGNNQNIDHVTVTWTPLIGTNSGDCDWNAEDQECVGMPCKWHHGKFTVDVEPDSSADVYNQPGGDINHRAHIRGGILGSSQDFKVTSGNQNPANVDCNGALIDLLIIEDMYDEQYNIAVRCTACPS